MPAAEVIKGILKGKNVTQVKLAERINVKKVVNLEQFVMPATERGQNADSYIRELRDNDRI